MVAENSMVWRPGGGWRTMLLDVGQEAQVEHLVGLVEHQRAHVAQVEEALLGQVDQPTRRADDDLDAALQRLDLRLVGPAAVDADRTRIGRVAAAFAMSPVTCTHSSRVGTTTRACGLPGVTVPAVASSASLVGGHDALQQRDAEAERLAGAGLGLADDVVPAQGHRQGQRLDRERVGDADGLRGPRRSRAARRARRS